MAHKLRGKNNPFVDSPLIPMGERDATFAPTVNYCSHCGQAMSDPRSFITEYWRSEQNVYFCWCHSCGYLWESTEVKQLTTMELEEEE